MPFRAGLSRPFQNIGLIASDPIVFVLTKQVTPFLCEHQVIEVRRSVGQQAEAPRVLNRLFKIASGIVTQGVIPKKALVQRITIGVQKSRKLTARVTEPNPLAQELCLLLRQ